MVGWHPWHPEAEVDPPGSPMLLTGTPARWVSTRVKAGSVDKYGEADECCTMFADGLGNQLDAADIRQGQLVADVWLLSAVACLTEYPDVLPTLFAERAAGLQASTKIRLFLRSTGKWRVLHVDDTLPVTLKEQKPLHSTLLRHRDSAQPVWLPLLEKACAQLVGGYPALAGGHPAAAFQALTGDPVEVFAFEDAKGRWSQLDYGARDVLNPGVGGGGAGPLLPSVVGTLECDEMWARMWDACARGYYLACGTEGVIASGAEDRQAFAIVELHQVGQLRLACVRNPWSSFRWKGDWCESSEKWDAHPEVLRAVNPVLEGAAEFYISFEDLRASFYQLYIVQRGAGKNTSLRFMMQCAFTEPAELARQAGAHTAARRAQARASHGVTSCLPHTNRVIHALGAAAGAGLVRATSACASVARKIPSSRPAPSPAEAASSLGGSEEAPVVGAPAGSGMVVGRPAVRAAIDRIRRWGAPVTGTPANAANTAVGYSVWPVAPFSSSRPAVVLRAYLRGEEPPPRAQQAPSSPMGGEAPMANRGAEPEPNSP